MVIECIGLPGSGNTELMELVGKELRRREVDYVDVTARLSRNIIWKILFKIARTLVYLSADARWLRERLRKILREEGELSSAYGLFGKEDRVIRSIAFYSFLYRRMLRSHKLYLFDDGMAQLLALFGADRGLSVETLRKLVRASEQGVRSARIVIFCETSPEDSLAFLESGGRIPGASGVPDSDKRAAFLADCGRMLETYRRNFRVLEIRKEDENRKKLSRVFGRIRQVLSDNGSVGR